MYCILLPTKDLMVFLILFCFFFFKQKTAYEITASDWSSDVCSSDLLLPPADHQPGQDRGRWSGGPADRPGGRSGRNRRGGVRGGSRRGAREAARSSSRHARSGPGR